MPRIKVEEVSRVTRIEPMYLTVRETAEFLKKSEMCIRRYLTEGRLRRFKCGTRTLISIEDAKRLVTEV
jgi:excisionase family DNA binding protein